ncbi:MAG: S24/S26 family peptidase [Bacilli bacterium]|nr:S24/S26 family peptidase [Bacilli bacterium]
MKELTYQEIIDQYGGFIYYPVGTSMLPLIVEGVHSVKLEKINRPIRKYDIVLYHRDNDQYVLHRVVRVHEDFYDMKGDNQFMIEKNIRKDQVIAIMSGLYCQEQIVPLQGFRYQISIRMNLWFRHFRRLFQKIKHLLKRKK